MTDAERAHDSQDSARTVPGHIAANSDTARTMINAGAETQGGDLIEEAVPEQLGKYEIRRRPPAGSCLDRGREAGQPACANGPADSRRQRPTILGSTAAARRSITCSAASPTPSVLPRSR